MAAIETKRKFPSAIAAGGDGAMEFLFFVTFSIAREYMVYKVKNFFRIKGHL